MFISLGYIGCNREGGAESCTLNLVPRTAPRQREVGNISQGTRKVHNNRKINCDTVSRALHNHSNRHTGEGRYPGNH
jgi:hypothetical protein